MMQWGRKCSFICGKVIFLDSCIFSYKITNRPTFKVEGDNSLHLLQFFGYTNFSLAIPITKAHFWWKGEWTVLKGWAWESKFEVAKRLLYLLTIIIYATIGSFSLKHVNLIKVKFLWRFSSCGRAERKVPFNLSPIVYLFRLYVYSMCINLLASLFCEIG